MLVYGSKWKLKSNGKIFFLGQGYIQNEKQYYYIGGALFSEALIKQHYELVK